MSLEIHISPRQVVCLGKRQVLEIQGDEIKLMNPYSCISDQDLAVIAWFALASVLPNRAGFKLSAQELRVTRQALRDFATRDPLDMHFPPEPDASMDRRAEARQEEDNASSVGG